MKTNKFKARGVSLPSDMASSTEKRLEGLHPWVTSFSAYVQRLIALDLERSLLNPDGGVNQSVVGKGKKPFSHAPASLSIAAV